MNPNVDYKGVVDALADAVQELNRGSHAPHAPHAAHAELLSTFDVEGLIDELLLMPERSGAYAHSGSSIADTAADAAAAEHSASAQEFIQLVPIFTALSTALAVYGVAKDAYSLYQMFRRRRR